MELFYSGNARQVDSVQIARELRETQIIEGWHVFYFEFELSLAQRWEFENRIVGFFRTVPSELLSGHARKLDGLKYLGEGLSCEFRATTRSAIPLGFHCSTVRVSHFIVTSQESRRIKDDDS